MRNPKLFSVKYLVENDSTPHYASGSNPCSKQDFDNGVYSKEYLMDVARELVRATMESEGLQGDFKIVEFEFPVEEQ